MKPPPPPSPPPPARSVLQLYWNIYVWGPTEPFTAREPVTFPSRLTRSCRVEAPARAHKASLNLSTTGNAPARAPPRSCAALRRAEGAQVRIRQTDRRWHPRVSVESAQTCERSVYKTVITWQYLESDITGQNHVIFLEVSRLMGCIIWKSRDMDVLFADRELVCSDCSFKGKIAWEKGVEVVRKSDFRRD